MTGVLTQRRNWDTERDIHREDPVKTHRENSVCRCGIAVINLQAKNGKDYQPTTRN